MSKKKQIILKRRVTTPTTSTVIRIDSEIKEILDKLKMSKRIPKYDLENDIVYKKYATSDVIFDLIAIYKIVLKGLLDDPETAKKLERKSKKPYAILHLMLKMGAELPDMDEIDLGGDEL